MFFSTYFSRQAKKPTGIFGRYIVSRIFDKGNSELNELVYKTLSVKNGDHVLEIGFGTGKLLKKISNNIKNGIVEGVDFSTTMVEMAKKKNINQINNGKVIIHSGDFDKIPFKDNCFDVIFTVNTIYFWSNPNATFSKIFKYLKPGGKVIVGFHDKSEMENMPLDTDIFQYFSTHDLTTLLSSHTSLDNIEIISKSGAKKTCYCAVAIN